MARPRKVKYRDGIIEIRNLQPQDADLVEEIIRKSEPKWHPFEDTISIDKLNQEAYTICRSQNKMYLVSLKFDIESRKAMVTEIKEVEGLMMAEIELKKVLGQNIFGKLRQQ